MSVKYKHDPDIAWRVIEDEVVILKIKTTTYYSLDPVGSFIWKAMSEEPRAEEDLVRVVLNEYDAEEETVRSDVSELIADLTTEELLREETAGG